MIFFKINPFSVIFGENWWQNLYKTCIYVKPFILCNITTNYTFRNIKSEICTIAQDNPTILECRRKTIMEHLRCKLNKSQLSMQNYTII